MEIGKSKNVQSGQEKKCENQEEEEEEGRGRGGKGSSSGTGRRCNRMLLLTPQLSSEPAS